MQETQTVAISAIAAIAGMGGVGKSELALQYALAASLNQQYKGGICWLNARSADVGIQIVSFARTYLKLQIPDGLELPNQVAHCWQNWLPGDVLIVLDDLKDYQQVKPYLPPQNSRFKVLITTRLQLGAPIKPIDLQVLTPDAALDLLRSYIGERVDSELGVAEKLCNWLGYLPLGLELVGRYLADDEDLSLEEIQKRLLEKAPLEYEALVETHPEMTARLGVAAAFELSWQELDENAQVLGDLLSLFALAPIPWSLVESATDFWQEYQTHQGINSLANSESPLKRTEDTDASRFKPTSAISPELKFRAGKATIPDLKKARRALLKFNLIKRTKKDTYQLHQLIREFFQDKRENSAEADQLKQAFAQVMVEIAQTIPEALTLDDIAKVQDAIPHLEEVARNLMLVSQAEDLVWLKLDDIDWSFIGLGRFYKGQGLYAQAEPLFVQALELFQRLLGDNHLSVANTLNNLAYLYKSQGRYSEAEPLYLQALELYKRLLGENHPLVATSLNNLAELYRSQGRYSEAEPLYLQALELGQRLLVENHPHVATSLNNLALLYYSQGRYSEAEPLYLQALELRTRLLGENHPDVATSLNNLAGLYDSQGRYDKAEPLYLQALELRTRLLGENHPLVATSLNNLALLYYSQGRYSEAELLFVQALELRQRLLGENHPDVAQSINNLAGLYKSQGRYEQAEPLYLQALELYKHLLGENHPSVASSLNNLAGLYFSQGRYEQAEPLYLQALELSERVLGLNHPNTVTFRKNLQILRARQGD